MPLLSADAWTEEKYLDGGLAIFSKKGKIQEFQLYIIL